MRYDKASNGDSDFSTSLKAILFGAAVGATICAGFLFLFAFLFVIVKSIPQFLIQVIAIFCAAIGAFVAGYIAARVYRFRGLVYGSLAGLFLFVLLTLVAFIVSRDRFTYLTLVRLLVMTLAGAFGGVLSVNKKRR